MSETWAVVAGLTLTTALIRASGPMLLGGRRLGGRARSVVGLLAPALLAALVVVETFSDADGLILDERAAGVAAAGLTLLWRESWLLPMGVAVVVTAVLRALL